MDGKFRNLKVKVDQGDTQLRYRKGFFALDPALDKKGSFEQDVAAALELAGASHTNFIHGAGEANPR